MHSKLVELLRETYSNNIIKIVILKNLGNDVNNNKTVVINFFLKK